MIFDSGGTPNNLHGFEQVTFSQVPDFFGIEEDGVNCTSCFLVNHLEPFRGGGESEGALSQLLTWRRRDQGDQVREDPAIVGVGWV
jgi:hypothetical protein